MIDHICPFCGTALSEHPAGRCLDGWISKVKGYQVDQGPVLFIGSWNWRQVWPGSAHDPMMYALLPYYSTAWLEAGELLEEMGQAENGADLFVPGNGCGRWRMEFWQPGAMDDLHLRVFLAETGPHVVARAYIAWKERQE